MRASGKTLRVATIALGVWAGTAAPSLGNPFLPPPSDADAQPVGEAAVRAIVAKEIAASERRMRELHEADLRMIEQRLEEIAVPMTSPMVPATDIDEPRGQGDEPSPAPAPVLPEGAKFLACVNGKALYRDPEGVTHLISIADPSRFNPCAD